MVTIKYIGPGRYGTAEPKKIWAPDEVKDVPSEVADVLLQDPYFVKVVAEPKTKPESPIEKAISAKKSTRSRGT